MIRQNWGIFPNFYQIFILKIMDKVYILFSFIFKFYLSIKSPEISNVNGLGKLDVVLAGTVSALDTQYLVKLHTSSLVITHVKPIVPH